MSQEYEIAVEGRAYLLRPDTPKEGSERPPRPGESPDHLAEPVKGAAEAAGLIMRPPPRTPNTLYALEATEYAQQHGKFLEFHHAAYKALWDDGKDISDLTVLQTIADSVDLDSVEMREGLESGQYSETVMAQYQEALQHGIQGIPTFLVGNLMFTGAHPYEIFQSAMSRVLAQE